MIAGGLLPVIILSFIIGPRIYTALLDDALLHNHAINNRIVIALDEELFRLTSILENKSDAVAHGLKHLKDKDFINLLLEKVLDREGLINAIAVVDPVEGVNFYMGRYNDSIDSQGREKRSYISSYVKNKSSLGFDVPLEGGGSYVSPILRSEEDAGYFVFLIAVPVNSVEGQEGVLVAEVSAGDMINIIGDRFVRPDSHTYIVDGSGELLQVLGNDEYISGMSLKNVDIVGELSPDNAWDDRKEYKGLVGNTVFGTKGKARSASWSVISEVSKSNILSPIYETIYTSFAVVLAVVILFIWLGLLIARRMISPIDRLIDAFKKAARHDYSTTNIESPLEEFQQLAKGYDVMVYEIENRQKRLEESKIVLEETEDRFRTVTENIHEVLLIISAYWEEVIYVSPAYESIWGFSCDSLYIEPWSWSKAIHVADQQRVNINIIKLADAPSNKPVSFPEFRIQSADGEIKWIFAKAYPVHDDKEEIVSYVYIMEEVTQQKEAQLEQKKLQHQLQQSQKMEAIGQLTGGIAHDFNNMLTAIMGYTGLALDRFGKDVDPKLVEYLNEVDLAGERARDLISQLLLFSRESNSEPEAIIFAPLIKEVTRMLQISFPKNIDIWNEVQSDLPPVLMDPVRLHQLIMNLCINARDAIDGNGSITISSLLVSHYSGVCNACYKSFQGDFVELIIEDTGFGIGADAMSRIFDPFFTTKELGKGTGMGLSIVHGIVHDLGGHIHVNTGSTGTAFRLFFPVIEKLVEDVDINKEKIEQVQAGQGQHILVIDDEVSVARFEGELLNHYGYKAKVITDSEEAMAEFMDNPDKYDLVITDQSMPKMTGTELVSAMLKVRPDLPIILSTGYIDDLNPHPQEVRAMGVREVQVKPINGQDLIKMVQKYLS